MWDVFMACGNINTCWLSMLAPAMRLMNEYKPLLTKLHEGCHCSEVKEHCKEVLLWIDGRSNCRWACVHTTHALSCKQFDVGGSA